jgi:hypothetical protein
MITDAIKTRLQEIAGSEHLWASQRASYMTSVIAQVESRWIDQTTVTDWMHDVIRRLDEDAGDSDLALSGEIKSLAMQIGDITA